MNASEQLDLLAAIKRVDYLVLGLPYSGGVVSAGLDRETPEAALRRIESNIKAIKNQYEAFAASRQRDADDLCQYRSLRGALRGLLKD